MTATSTVVQIEDSGSVGSTDGLGNAMHASPPPSLPSTEPELVAIANAILRDVGDVRGERAANFAAERVEVDRVKAGYAELDLSLARREESLERELERVTRALPLRNKKSRNLPFGVVGWKSSPVRVEVTDEAALRGYLVNDFPLYAKLTRKVEEVKLDRKAISAYVLETGEVLAGTQVVPSIERFYVTVSEPKVA